MVSALDSRSSIPGLSAGQCCCVLGQEAVTVLFPPRARFFQSPIKVTQD